MVLVIKIAVGCCNLGNALVTGKNILGFFAVYNLKMITDVMGVSPFESAFLARVSLPLAS